MSGAMSATVGSRHSITQLIEAFNWTVAKSDLGQATGLPDEALHALAGMLVLTVAAYLLRRPPWTWRPWLVVVVAEAINEAYDLTQTIYPTDEGNWRGSFHDFWLTVLWPTLILILWPRFVGLAHDGGPLARLRRLVHSRQYLGGFCCGLVIALAAAVWLW